MNSSFLDLVDVVSAATTETDPSSTSSSTTTTKETDSLSVNDTWQPIYLTLLLTILQAILSLLFYEGCRRNPKVSDVYDRRRLLYPTKVPPPLKSKTKIQCSRSSWRIIPSIRLNGWFEWWKLSIVDQEYWKESQEEYDQYRREIVEREHAKLYRTKTNYFDNDNEESSPSSISKTNHRHHQQQSSSFLIEAERQCYVESPYYFPPDDNEDVDDEDVNRANGDADGDDSDKYDSSTYQNTSNDNKNKFDDRIEDGEIEQHKQPDPSPVSAAASSSPPGPRAKTKGILRRVSSLQNNHMYFTTNNNDKIETDSQPADGGDNDDELPISSANNAPVMMAAKKATATTPTTTMIGGDFQSPIQQHHQQHKTTPTNNMPRSSKVSFQQDVDTSVSPVRSSVSRSIQAVGKHIQRRVLMIDDDDNDDGNDHDNGRERHTTVEPQQQRLPNSKTTSITFDNWDETNGDDVGRGRGSTGSLRSRTRSIGLGIRLQNHHNHDTSFSSSNNESSSYLRRHEEIVVSSTDDNHKDNDDQRHHDRSNSNGKIKLYSQQFLSDFRDGKVVSRLFVPTKRRTLKKSQRKLLAMVGLDTFVLLRLLQWGFDIAFYPLILACVMLIPVYVTGGGGEVGFFSATVSNLVSESWKLWIVVVYGYLHILYILRRLWVELELFLPLRYDFLENGDRVTNHKYQNQYRKTCIVEYIPRSHRNDEKLYTLFDGLFPGQIRRAETLLNTEHIASLIRQRLSNLAKFELVYAKKVYRRSKYLKQLKGVEHRKGICGKILAPRKPSEPKHIVKEQVLQTNWQTNWWNSTQDPNSRLITVVDYKTYESLPYYKETISKINKQIEDEYIRLARARRRDVPKRKESSVSKWLGLKYLYDGWDDGRVQTSTGFVQFKTLTAKMEAIQCNKTGTANLLEVNAVREVRDLMWHNLHVSRKLISRRTIYANFINVGCLIVFSMIVSFIRGYTHPSEHLFGDTDLPERYPTLVSFIDDYLPPLIIEGLVRLTPRLLRLICRWIRFKSQSEVIQYVFRWYFAYRSMTFLFIIIGGSLVEVGEQVFEDPVEYIQELGRSIANQSQFFTTYIIVAGGIQIFFRLSQFQFVLLHWWTFKTTTDEAVSTRRLQKIRTVVRDIHPEEFLPTILFIFTISVFYGFVAPISNLFVAVIYYVAYKNFKYMALFIYSSNYESGGQLFYTLTTLVLWILYAYIVVLSGFFTVSGGPLMSVVFLMLLIVVSMVHVNINTMFLEPSKTLSLAKAREFDMRQEQKRKESEYRRRRRQRQNYDSKLNHGEYFDKSSSDFDAILKEFQTAKRKLDEVLEHDSCHLKLEHQRHHQPDVIAKRDDIESNSSPNVDSDFDAWQQRLMNTTNQCTNPVVGVDHEELAIVSTDDCHVKNDDKTKINDDSGSKIDEGSQNTDEIRLALKRLDDRFYKEFGSKRSPSSSGMNDDMDEDETGSVTRSMSDLTQSQFDDSDNNIAKKKTKKKASSEVDDIDSDDNDDEIDDDGFFVYRQPALNRATWETHPRPYWESPNEDYFEADLWIKRRG